jgi:lipopolysaccharide assembly outer membrane protein LptD (OstA)
LLFLVPASGWCEEPADSSVYTLLKEGTPSQLQAECNRRGLSIEGSAEDLKRRLLASEIEAHLVPFQERAEASKEGDIVLQHADFIEHGEGEGGQELIRLSGEVAITYREKRISADEVRINVDGGIITGSGNVVFLDEYGKRYIAEEFFYDTEADEGIFFEGKTSLKKFIRKNDQEDTRKRQIRLRRCYAFDL